MEIRQLKYFAAVADTLNFSRAAETLFISQSALSKQIADLERELGMVLLQRDKRSVRLTPAGKVFLNEAKVILMRMDTIPILLKNTEDIEKKEKRNVFIGVESRVGDSPIFHLGVAEAVHQLRQEMPTLRAIFKMGEYLDINRDISEETLNGTNGKIQPFCLWKVLRRCASTLSVLPDPLNHVLFLISIRDAIWTASVCRINIPIQQRIALCRINQNVPLHELLYLRCGHLINLIRCFRLLKLPVHIKKEFCPIGIPRG